MGPIKSEKSVDMLPTLPYPDPALAAMGKYIKNTRWKAQTTPAARPFLRPAAHIALSRPPPNRPPGAGVETISQRPRVFSNYFPS